MNDNTRVTLLDRVRSGEDDNAWAEFAGIYGRYLYLIVRGLGIDQADADDLVQECLLVIWKAMPTFEYRKNNARFRTWAAVVARRVVLDYCRKRDRRIKTNSLETLGAVSDTDIGENPDFLAFVDREWRTYLVNLALERIRPHFSGKAIAVFEAAIAGEEPAAIAERLSLQPDSVRKLRGRVTTRLEQEIKELRRQLD